ncbi:MAG: type II toxin-antitoxin system RelE/ParE family toxin [Rhodospirillales bacterium]
MKVVWAAKAVQDRFEIFESIEHENPKAAANMDDSIAAAGEALSEFPERGQLGFITGTRELHPHPSYRIVYEISDGVVFILSVVHTRREWPPAQ